MKYLRWLHIIIIFTFLSACSSVPINVPGIPTDTPLPPPIVSVTSVPNPEIALGNYLMAFQTDDYNTMYALLSKVTQDAVPLDAFALRNRDALNEMSAG